MIRLTILIVAAVTVIGLAGCCNSRCPLRSLCGAPAEPVQSESPADK